jgi:hypothetical protein
MDDGEFAVVGIEGLVAQSVLIDDAGTSPGRRAGGAVDGDHGRPASGAATDLGVENRARHVRRYAAQMLLDGAPPCRVLEPTRPAR